MAKSQLRIPPQLSFIEPAVKVMGLEGGGVSPCSDLSPPPCNSMSPVIEAIVLFYAKITPN